MKLGKWFLVEDAPDSRWNDIVWETWFGLGFSPSACLRRGARSFFGSTSTNPLYKAGLCVIG